MAARRRMPTEPSWLADEPPLRGALLIELQRLRRRARARLGLVLLGGGLLTALLVVKVVRKPRFYEAKIVLAVTEGGVSAADDEAGPMQDLQDHVSTVLLTSERLLAIIEELDLFPQRRSLGNEHALTGLRALFSIEVYHNYFLVGREEIDEPRSVRLAIRFRHPDPELAWQMVQRLETTIVDAENQRRADDAAFTRARAREMAQRGQTSMDELSARLNATMIALARAEAQGDDAQMAVQRVEMVQLKRALLHDQEAAVVVSSIENSVALGLAAESEHVGLRFAVADERHPYEEERSLASLVALALLGLMTLVPATAILIGAFDSRVHEADDVVRLGLPVIGHVPRFRGDNVGSLVTRGAPRLRRPAIH